MRLPKVCVCDTEFPAFGLSDCNPSWLITGNRVFLYFEKGGVTCVMLAVGIFLLKVYKKEYMYIRVGFNM